VAQKREINVRVAQNYRKHLLEEDERNGVIA